MRRVVHVGWQAEYTELPAGLQIGFGAAAVVVATIGGAMMSASAGSWRALPVALTLLLFAAFPSRISAVVFTTALGYLLVIGFLVNQFGQLSWHGVADADRMLLLGAAAGVGFTAGALRRRFGRPYSVRKDLSRG
jgi:hypothetical protein